MTMKIGRMPVTRCLGMHRPPWEEFKREQHRPMDRAGHYESKDWGGAYRSMLFCTCDTNISTPTLLREHWQAGHFDTPIYEMPPPSVPVDDDAVFKLATEHQSFPDIVMALSKDKLRVDWLDASHQNLIKLTETLGPGDLRKRIDTLIEESAL